MSTVEQTEIVDMVGIDEESGNVVLAIFDPLGWECEHERLLLLENKLNAYLRFIDSGELVQKVPNARDRRVLVEVIGRKGQSPKAREFFQKAKGFFGDSGIGLRFKHWTGDESESEQG